MIDMVRAGLDPSAAVVRVHHAACRGGRPVLL